MSKAALGRDTGRELVKAMGLPVESCMSVDVDLPLDGFATVTVTYPLTADALAVAAKALKESGQ